MATNWRQDENMGFKILFEDNENMPLSVALSKSMYGKNIHFVEGAERFWVEANKLEVLYPDDDILIYYDISPNNERTIQGYTNLKDTIADKSIYKKIYLIPIICIEYIALKMLYTYKYLEYLKVSDKNKYNIIENFVGTFNYSKVVEFAQGRSLEKTSKSLLNGLNQHRCMANKNTNNDWGKFYRQDCDCSGCNSNQKNRDGLDLKANRLYAQLPICKIPDYNIFYRLTGIRLKQFNLMQAERELQNFYDLIIQDMGKVVTWESLSDVTVEIHPTNVKE